MIKATVAGGQSLSEINGRGERIRTSDLTVPNRALYQAEPRPECLVIIEKRGSRVK